MLGQAAHRDRVGHGDAPFGGGLRPPQGVIGHGREPSGSSRDVRAGSARSAGVIRESVRCGANEAAALSDAGTADRRADARQVIGISATTSVPWPAWAVDRQRGRRARLTRSWRPRMPGAASLVGAADAVVADLDPERRRRHSRPPTLAWVADAYFATLASASETTKYAVASTAAESRPVRQLVDHGRNDRAFGKGSDRRHRDRLRSGSPGGCRARARAAPGSRA